jgi:hypothetical protein
LCCCVDCVVDFHESDEVGKSRVYKLKAPKPDIKFKKREGALKYF